MTEQEFTSLIETYGFEMDIQENYIFVRIPNRYNKPMQYIEFYKKDRYNKSINLTSSPNSKYILDPVYIVTSLVTL